MALQAAVHLDYHTAYELSRQSLERRMPKYRPALRRVESLGFDGHYSSVYRAIAGTLKRGELIKANALQRVPMSRLSPTAAAWLLIHPDEKLDSTQRKFRDRLCALSAEVECARQLAQAFCTLLRERQPHKLDDWLLAAEQSGIKVLRNFAAGLRRDYKAVKAALTYKWSSGQVEGQINRLKTVRREMYGRAKFDLLRKRVVGLPTVM